MGATTGALKVDMKHILWKHVTIWVGLQNGVVFCDGKICTACEFGATTQNSTDPPTIANLVFINGVAASYIVQLGIFSTYLFAILNF